MTSLVDSQVALYVEGQHELAVLEPIGAELARRGAHIRTTGNFDEPAQIGLYACHTNRFFDFKAERWRRPPNELSVLAVHDLGQAGMLDAGYFDAEPWHAFDLGLLPGPEWAGMWRRAAAGGATGPSLGMHVVGWPKMDHVHSDPETFAHDVRSLRDALGLGRRPVVLLACSWSDRRQLADAVRTLGGQEVDLVVKYPAPSDPPADSPWFGRLTAAAEERARARAAAHEDDHVVVADDDADIMALVSLADVVLSNGSNVLYESVLAGVPGISIRDWVHPAGSTGDETIRPLLDLSGVISGDVASIPNLLRVVRESGWQPLVARSGAALVEPATRGTAAVRAADAIDAALALGPIELARRRSPLDAPADESAVARQLLVYEQELKAAQAALAASGERELRARDQLQIYQQQIAELRARPG
jgi:hypothetical protein